MTIVDSINKITKSLGGDTTGVQTASEAIDALGPVIGGGGGSTGYGTVEIVIPPASPTEFLPPEVTLDGLTSIEKYFEYTRTTLLSFQESAHCKFYTEYPDGLQYFVSYGIGTHGFKAKFGSAVNPDIIEYVIQEVVLPNDTVTEVITNYSGVYRIWRNGVFGDWDYLNIT